MDKGTQKTRQDEAKTTPGEKSRYFIFDGALRGATPIPLMHGLFRKGTPLTYEKNDPVYLRFPKELWQDLFTGIESPRETAQSI